MAAAPPKCQAPRCAAPRRPKRLTSLRAARSDGVRGAAPCPAARLRWAWLRCFPEPSPDERRRGRPWRSGGRHRRLSAPPVPARRRGRATRRRSSRPGRSPSGTTESTASPVPSARSDPGATFGVRSQRALFRPRLRPWSSTCRLSTSRSKCPSWRDQLSASAAEPWRRTILTAVFWSTCWPKRESMPSRSARLWVAMTQPKPASRPRVSSALTCSPSWTRLVSSSTRT